MNLSAGRKIFMMLVAAVLVCTAFAIPPADASDCIPDGGIDDTLGRTSCCSGHAVPGSTYCINPDDYNNGWASCTQICGDAT